MFWVRYSCRSLLKYLEGSRMFPSCVSLLTMIPARTSVFPAVPYNWDYICLTYWWSCVWYRQLRELLCGSWTDALCRSIYSRLLSYFSHRIFDCIDRIRKVNFAVLRHQFDGCPVFRSLTENFQYKMGNVTLISGSNIYSEFWSVQNCLLLLQYIPVFTCKTDGWNRDFIDDNCELSKCSEMLL